MKRLYPIVWLTS